MATEFSREFFSENRIVKADLRAAHQLREEDIARIKAEVKKLAAKIEEECGVTITPERLKAAIHAVNEKRRALQRLAATRAADPAPISGLDSLLTVQAAFMDDTPRLTGAINDMAAECEQRVEAGEGVAPKGTKRILYTGTPMAVPNWKLFNLIEKAGGVVVGEESCTGSRYYKDLVDESGETVDEMLDAIAEAGEIHFKTDNRDLFEWSLFQFPRVGFGVSEVTRDLHADGIVDVALQFCTLYEMESFAVEKAAEEAAQAAGTRFQAVCPDAEISVLSGGQPVYYYIISFE